VHDPVTRNVTCVCEDGFKGEFCDVSSADLLERVLSF
jgi:hypothetical protein